MNTITLAVSSNEAFKKLDKEFDVVTQEESQDIDGKRDIVTIRDSRDKCEIRAEVSKIYKQVEFKRV